MAHLQEKTITELKDFIELLDGFYSSVRSVYWYRGVGDSIYKLKPSIYRHPEEKGKKEFQELEKGLINRFKERAISYLSHNKDNNWEYLFLMQHYGIPTRLLDWTENPLIALFFALTSAEKKDFKHDAAVWALSPAYWNQHIFSHISYGGGALSVMERCLRPYGPLSDDIDSMPALPAAIYGIHNSQRIIAQRGVFTIFGSENKPMEEVFQNEKFDDNALIKIIIPKENLKFLFNKLLSIGYTDAVVYPGLDGLAKETIRAFGFEVNHV